MNKNEFIARVAESTGQTKALSAQMVDAVFGNITSALKAGEQVSIVGFGIFTVKHRNARMGRNPKTGEPAPIPASKLAVLKPGKPLREEINR